MILANSPTDQLVFGIIVSVALYLLYRWFDREDT